MSTNHDIEATNVRWSNESNESNNSNDFNKSDKSKKTNESNEFNEANESNESNELKNDSNDKSYISDNEDNDKIQNMKAIGTKSITDKLSDDKFIELTIDSANDDDNIIETKEGCQKYCIII